MASPRFVTPSCLSNQLLCQLVLLALVLSSLAGCSKRYSDMPAYWPVPFREWKNQAAGRFKSSYLAEQIDAYYRGTNPGPIGVTTFVNVDDLYSTSSFGRVYSEQIISELAMKGFDVIELRHSDALQFLMPDGEFALSRDVSQIKKQRELGGVIVGTYSVSPNRVFVNARLLDPSTSMVLSAGSVEMEKTKEISKMLRGGGQPATLERIPVKHLGIYTYPAAAAPPIHPVDPLEAGLQGDNWSPAIEPKFEVPPPQKK